MTDPVFNVLFLCTGNSARSIFAECLINHLGQGRFRGYSAGSHPAGRINPYTLYELGQQGIPRGDLRSKDWSEYAAPGAPPMDFVFTVCDRAAAESCPVWPGQPMTAHWGVADPAAVSGDDITRKAAFARAYAELRNRIAIFVNLPLASLDRLRLQQELDAIGRASLVDTLNEVSA